MKTSEYLQIINLDSGTTSEFELGNIFNLNLSDYKTLEDFTNDIKSKQIINEEYKLPDNGTFIVNGKKWIYDKDILNTSPEQWAKLHEVLARIDELIDPELLAIYIRHKGEIFDIRKLDVITNEVYEFPAEIFIALNNFFFQKGIEYINYMKIYYLNQINLIKRKKRLLNSVGFGKLIRGFLYVKVWLEMTHLN